ncbi:hypothetical protein [Pedobacter sp. SYSU D00535]|uniref:hypothetical protein n=1 Tax=Pedobacter sp. SYSU D00535 TaxID=2810308 RepID=UPI001A968969|nr:hypothetical protein [Pedobacter sp. SYSU D00535]
MVVEETKNQSEVRKIVQRFIEIAYGEAEIGIDELTQTLHDGVVLLEEGVLDEVSYLAFVSDLVRLRNSTLSDGQFRAVCAGVLATSMGLSDRCIKLYLDNAGGVVYLLQAGVYIIP